MLEKRHWKVYYEVVNTIAKASLPLIRRLGWRRPPSQKGSDVHNTSFEYVNVTSSILERGLANNVAFTIVATLSAGLTYSPQIYLFS